MGQAAVSPKIQVASIGEIKAQSVYTRDQPAGAIPRHSSAVTLSDLTPKEKADASQRTVRVG